MVITLFCIKKLDVYFLNYAPVSYPCLVVLMWGTVGGTGSVLWGVGDKKEGDTQDTKGGEFVFVSVGPPGGIVG